MYLFDATRAAHRPTALLRRCSRKPKNKTPNPNTLNATLSKQAASSFRT